MPGCASSIPSSQWLYVITFGGGLVEGDNVSLDVKVGEHCTVVVTTQASTKVSKVVILPLTLKIQLSVLPSSH